ncbi:hypothetical protein MMC06_001322 [Schaereria dolodes]|nr:hypothetical protein [Schaereria dolodes]
MSRATATVNGTRIADTDEWETVEGNIYFPPSSVNKSLLSESSTTTVCPWKGTASYYDINVDGKELKDAAWYYPQPKDEKAKKIRDFVAFYKSKVEIQSS